MGEILSIQTKNMEKRQQQNIYTFMSARTEKLTWMLFFFFKLDTKYKKCKIKV